MVGKRTSLAIFSVIALVATMCSVVATQAQAATTTYTATETIPVPPPSAYAGSAGGDGWALAITPTEIFNVFHHQATLQVACHLQSDASACWSPETITDTSGDNFATSGQPGLWINQTTGNLYVFATRSSDQTGGVVCIDTAEAATNTDPFCGFTALTPIGGAPIDESISAISDPTLVGNFWFAFDYANGSAASSSENNLLCFDTTTLAPCSGQPFAVNIGAGTVSDGDFPPPAVAAIGSQVIVPVTVGSTDELACFNGASLTSCAGTWPVPIAIAYDSNFGAPFPLLSSAGAITGFCLPANSDPCFSLTGASVTAPAGMAAAIGSTLGWNGPALTLGPRVYVPDANADSVECFDASTDSSCTNFPKAFQDLGLLYTVNADPQRPTCFWVNSDNGSEQIQNFDAYTGGACGQGPIRVLASSFVVPTQLCIPTSYTSLQVQQPAPGSYTSGNVAFEDGDGNPIPGIATESLNGVGTVSLAGLSLNTAVGLPQFLITLAGASGTPSAVVVQLTWTGVNDPSCVPVGQTTPRAFVTTSDIPNPQLLQESNLSVGPVKIGANTRNLITINPNKKYQEIYGFGGTLTDSSATVLEEMSPATRSEYMNDLFNPTTGAGISVVRIAMGANDFTHDGDYTYDDVEGSSTDPLSNFSIGHDSMAIIPILKQAEAINPNIVIIASPWTAPPWMKTNDSYTAAPTRHLLFFSQNGTLESQDYGLYAQYFVKFIQAYEAQGIHINYVTPQNEPENAAKTYPAMVLSASQESNFISNDLTPALSAAGLNTQILGYDHNWDDTQYPATVLKDSPSVVGTSWHCYAGDVHAQSMLHNEYPSKLNFITECSGHGPDNSAQLAPNGPASLNGNLDWDSTNLIVGGLLNWASGVQFFNLALDQSDGPQNNGCKNCRGVITYHTDTGSVDLNVEYYLLAQAARAFDPGAIRVSTSSSQGNAVAALNPDGTTGLIVNNASKKSESITVNDNGQGFTYPIPPHAIASFRWTN